MASAADLAIKISAQDGASRVLHGVGNSLRGLGSGVGSAMSGLARPMGSVVTGLGQIGAAAQGAAAIVGGIGSVGSAVFGLGALNEIEQVRASINAFTKDGAQTENIIGQIKKEAASTPFAFAEMAKATASLMPVAKQSGVALMDLVKEAEILAASNPLEGLEGASFSLREAMTGDFTSIIERFNLSRQTINKLKEEGVPNIEIVRRAMAEMGFDSDLIAAKANTLEGRWSTFKDTLTELSTRMGQPIFDALKDGLVSVQGLLEGNMPLLEGFADTVAGAVRGGIEAAKAAFIALQPAIQVAVDAFKTIIQVFQDDWSPDESIDPIVNAIGQIAVVVKDVYQAVSTALPKIIGLFQNLGDIFTGGDSFDAAAEMLDSIFGPDVTDMILDWVMLAGDAFRSFSASFMELIGGVVSWFQANWPLIQQVTQQVAENVAQLWATHGQAIVDIIKAAWTIITNLIGGALDLIGSAVRAGMQLMTGDVTGAMETIGGLFERQWLRIQEMVGAAWTAILASIDLATGGALTTITTWLEGIGTAISAKFEGVSAWLTNWGGTLSTILLGVGSLAVDAARSIGSSIVDGIRWGIVNAATGLASAAADVVRGALEAARAAIDSNSPSKVFAEKIGKPIVDGIMMGMGDREPLLDKQMGAMVQPPLMPSYGAVGAGGYGGGTVINLTINGSVIHERELDQVVGQAFDNSLRYGGRLGRNG